MLVENLRRNFRNAEYAYSYADGFLNSRIATQIKVIREQRGWTQKRLATEAGMMQARISVLENVNYSAWSISTLRRLARAFGVRLNVSFEEFASIIPESEKFDRKSLQRKPLSNDPVFGAIELGAGLESAANTSDPGERSPTNAKRPPLLHAISSEQDDVGALSQAS